MFRTFTYASAIGMCLLALALTGCDLGEFNGEIIPNPVVQPPPNADPQGSCGGSCHGDVNSPSPPNDTLGNSESTFPGVGAHRAHQRVAPTWYQQIQCTECHIPVNGVGDPGHNNGNTDFDWGPIASADNVNAEYNGQTCGVYCHGVSMDGGQVTEPGWTDAGALTGCDACHGNPPGGNHPAIPTCSDCHQTMDLDDVTFLAPEKHINGTVETALDGGGEPGQPAQGCEACHGEAGVSSAPPVANNGETDPADSRVGAHRAHLGPSDWRREMFCSQCHEVPADVNAPGHMDDGDDQAEVEFDGLNPQASYDFNAYSCNNMYCHGPGFNQGSTESWVGNLDLGCTGCHDDGSNGGVEMSGAHDDHIAIAMQCSDCHGQVVNVAGVRAPDLHINGLHEVEITAGGVWDANAQACSDTPCHGAAPFPWNNQ